MTIRKLTTSDYLLIIVNLIPVYGVWFEGWSALQVFLVFCLETVIIGVFNVIKMACVTIFVKPVDAWETQGGSTLKSGLFFILFFIIHFGFFVFVQTQIFFAVTGQMKGSTLGKYSDIPRLLGDEGLLLLAIFIIYYTLQTLYDFFLSGVYKTISMGTLMFQPYGRIFVQQFVVIVGSMFLAFGLNNIFILILVLVKIWFEIFFNFDGLMKKAEETSKMEAAEKNDQVNN